jgi:hypothetical protein
LSHTSCPILLWLFWRQGVSKAIFLDWPWTKILWSWPPKYLGLQLWPTSTWLSEVFWH